MPGISRKFGGGGNICLGCRFARTKVPAAAGTFWMAFGFESFDNEPQCVPTRKDLMLGHATTHRFGNLLAILRVRGA